MNNTIIQISTGDSRRARLWFNKTMPWNALVERCAHPVRTSETVAEYAAMSRDQQGDIKDVGGFVGGTLRNDKRSKHNVECRTLITLDADFGTLDMWQRYIDAYPYAAMVYSTHKHTSEQPRFRVVMPANRPMTAEEYEPVARRWAERWGIDAFDHTTFQPERLMYWPSVSKDGEYYFRKQDGAPFDVDEVLSTYDNYRDPDLWPRTAHEKDLPAVRGTHRPADRPDGPVQDPRTKEGVIGAFCRCYGVKDAIAKFLSDIYEPSDIANRYTYLSGSTQGGLCIYDDLLAYSHHESDPAGGLTLNAFDLVRIHRFGDSDTGTDETDTTKLPSYALMTAFAEDDDAVKALLAAEAKSDFDGFVDDAPEAESAAGPEAPRKKPGRPKKKRKQRAINEDWELQLTENKDGTVENTAANVLTILQNDPVLSEHVIRDVFQGRDMVQGGLPWDTEAKYWSNNDDANLRVYLALKYGVTGRELIQDCKDAYLTEYRRRHPVRDYFNSLEWDGVPRLDRLVIDYIGAEDTELNRAMTRKWFTAAVTRIFNPGAKFDHVLLLAGKQGIGKSTLFGIMGGDWFTDSIGDLKDKDAMGSLRGKLIIELGELSVLRNADDVIAKRFFSSTVDDYRPAYGRVNETHPRQCVFAATTNETYFLKGQHGNRRMWVINVDDSHRRCSDFVQAISEDRDQLWAEAIARYHEREPLYLSPELEEQARQVQAAVNENADDPWVAMIASYLDTRLPSGWETYTLSQRRDAMRNADGFAHNYIERTQVCIPEIYCELFGREQGDRDSKRNSRRIARILNELGWTCDGRTTRQGVPRCYNPPQKVWVRPEKNEEDIL